MHKCSWTVTGTITASTYKTNPSGKGYWLLLVRVEKGDIALYVHEPEVQPIAENISLGTLVTAMGEILPHRQVSQTERPYFLSPTSILIS